MFFYLDISLVQQALYKQSMLVRKSQNNQFKFSETPPLAFTTIFPPYFHAKTHLPLTQVYQEAISPNQVLIPLQQIHLLAKNRI